MVQKCTEDGRGVARPSTLVAGRNIGLPGTNNTDKINQTERSSSLVRVLLECD